MKNQEQEVIVEEVVETEEKTKWFKTGWFKGAMLAVGGFALGVLTEQLLGGESEDQGDDCLDITSGELSELEESGAVISYEEAEED